MQPTLPQDQRVNAAPPPVAVEGRSVPPGAVPAPAEPPVVVTTQPEIRIYSHSSLFYWWPIWVVGFACAGLTFFTRRVVEVDGEQIWLHPNKNLGVLFFITLFLVILITNVTVRGLASALVIVSSLLVATVLALYDLWEPIFSFFGNLQIQLNLGAYFWFSSLVFLIWLFTVFVFDRMSYWRITPGQMTHEFVLGASAKSYDTENLVMEKFRDDVFRHWILGLGSGDLVLRPFGAQREEISVPNVLFIGSKIKAIQQLIAAEPEMTRQAPPQ